MFVEPEKVIDGDFKDFRVFNLKFSFSLSLYIKYHIVFFVHGMKSVTEDFMGG